MAGRRSTCRCGRRHWRRCDGAGNPHPGHDLAYPHRASRARWHLAAPAEPPGLLEPPAGVGLAAALLPAAFPAITGETHLTIDLTGQLLGQILIRQSAPAVRRPGSGSVVPASS